MPWSTSDRRSRLPKDWEKRREAVKRRAHGMCQWPGCDQQGNECDHIVPGDNHALSNLQFLCSTHHAAKTRAESQAARRVLIGSRKRPAERHPGLVS